MLKALKAFGNRNGGPPAAAPPGVRLYAVGDSHGCTAHLRKLHDAARKREEHRFHPPLDIVDGAARSCDPIFAGLSTGEHAWGRFFKDYRPAPW